MTKVSTPPHNALRQQLRERLPVHVVGTITTDAMEVPPYMTALAIGRYSLYNNRRKYQSTFSAIGNQKKLDGELAIRSLAEMHATPLPREAELQYMSLIPRAYYELAKAAYDLMGRNPNTVFSDPAGMYFLRKIGRRVLLVRTENPPVGVTYATIFDGSVESLFTDDVADLAQPALDAWLENVKANTEAINDVGRRIKHFGSCLLDIVPPEDDADFVYYEDPER